VSQAIDYAQARPDPAAVRAAGYSMVIRVLAPTGTDTAATIVDRSEAETLLNAGLDVTLAWQWYPSRVGEGAVAGEQDGTMARQMAEALGYPPASAIYFCCDIDPPDPRVTNAYFAAARTALGAGYRMGARGGFNVVNRAHDAGVVEVSHQDVANSEGQVCARSSLYRTGDRVWFGVGNDCRTSTIRGEYFGWRSAHGEAVVPAAQQVPPPAGSAPPPAARVAQPQPALDQDWLAVVTESDIEAKLEKIIDARLQYFLPRLAAMLRSGKPNTAFDADNAGGLIDNRGLDGLIRAAAAYHFMAVDKANQPLDSRVWVLVGDRIVRLNEPSDGQPLIGQDPSIMVHRLPPTHPFFRLATIT
jgi:hypothetical protein